MFKSSSKNVWMSKKDENNGDSYSFREELYLFLNTTICHCYRHLAQIDRSSVERFMWFCIHIFDCCALLFLTLSMWADFTESPLITTLHDTIYPIGNVPFPAVSICSNNRISKSQAIAYAKELALQDPGSKSAEEYLSDIENIGRIYDFESENEHLLTAFQQFLDTTISNTKIYNFSSIVNRLTPNCEDLLLKCFFKSNLIKCMTNYEMMETRLTASGFCCSFNFLRPKDSNRKNFAYNNEIPGPDMGLIIVLNATSEDYFYNIHNTKGFHIYIHNPKEFPDPMSGTAIQKFAVPGIEIFMNVLATSIASTDDILGYNADKRQCLFADEKKASYGGKYTRGECFLNCKIRSVKALCGCVPFQFPVVTGVTNPPKICTLQHVPCLNKYKLKWSTIMSQIIEIEGLEREMEESLICPECFPSCSDTKYLVSTTRLPLYPNDRRGFGLTNGITNVSDVTVIRVYFGQSEIWQYKQDVAFNWFEIFGNIGGLTGIVGGYSLIGFTEIFYFLARQIVFFFMRRFNIKRRSRDLQIYP